MGRFRVYVKPFDSFGEYEPDFIDISRDVLSLSDVNQSLDQTEFDIGVFRLSNLTLKLKNDAGRYLDAANPRSIFRFKRKDSLVKVTWDPQPEPLCVGFFKAGVCGPIQQEFEVFLGLLNEVSSFDDIDNQVAQFSVLGLESLFERVTVPIGSISDGDNVSDVFEAILDQTEITDLLTVSASNLNPDLDPGLDDVSSLENKTTREALSRESLLLVSNSVLTIKNQVIEIKPRDPSPDVKFEFFGQASIRGVENFIDISEFREGFNSVKNFWTWRGTTLKAQNLSSVETFGVQKKEISADVLTNTTKRQNALDALRDEFGTAKQELKIIAPINPKTIALDLLDRVTIDYPTVYVPADNNPLPVWGRAVWGEFLWPRGRFEITIPPTTQFNILSRKIKVSSQTIEFKLREI